MKNIIFILILTISYTLNAKLEHKYLKISPSVMKWEAKYGYNLVKLKYVSINPRTFGQRYEITVPMNSNSLALLSKKSNNSRFDLSNIQYNNRFKDLNKIDLNSIVEKNKLYNLSRTNVTVNRSF